MVVRLWEGQHDQSAEFGEFPENRQSPVTARQSDFHGRSFDGGKKFFHFVKLGYGQVFFHGRIEVPVDFHRSLAFRKPFFDDDYDHGLFDSAVRGFGRRFREFVLTAFFCALRFLFRAFGEPFGVLRHLRDFLFGEYRYGLSENLGNLSAYRFERLRQNVSSPGEFVQHAFPYGVVVYAGRGGDSRLRKRRRGAYARVIPGKKREIRFPDGRVHFGHDAADDRKRRSFRLFEKRNPDAGFVDRGWNAVFGHSKNST